jgi:hypothetical protein
MQSAYRGQKHLGKIINVVNHTTVIALHVARKGAFYEMVP